MISRKDLTKELRKLPPDYSMFYSDELRGLIYRLINNCMSEQSKINVQNVSIWFENVRRAKKEIVNVDELIKYLNS